MATVSSSPADQVRSINSRDDLIVFIRSLLSDLKTRPGSWENSQLDNYLEALAAWTKDMGGHAQNRGEPVPDEPSWRLFGEMLMAATMYE